MDADWRQTLEAYLQQHPSTRLIDPFEAESSLLTREEMLKPLIEPVTLHQPKHARQNTSTAELDTLSCAAPVQTPLRPGIQTLMFL